MNPYCFWLLGLDANWPLNEGLHHWTIPRGNNQILFSLLIATWWRVWLQHGYRILRLHKSWLKPTLLWLNRLFCYGYTQENTRPPSSLPLLPSGTPIQSQRPQLTRHLCSDTFPGCMARAWLIHPLSPWGACTKVNKRLHCGIRAFLCNVYLSRYI